MVSKQKQINRAFNFLQDVYNICEQEQPLQIAKTLERHKLYGKHFRKAILNSGLIEHVPETFPKIYVWVNSIVPNMLMAERMVKSAEAIKKREEVTHKQCPLCGESLPLSEFKDDPKLPSGKASKCKSCEEQIISTMQDYDPDDQYTVNVEDDAQDMPTNKVYNNNLDEIVDSIPLSQSQGPYFIIRIPKPSTSKIKHLTRLFAIFCMGFMVGLLMMWLWE